MNGYGKLPRMTDRNPAIDIFYLYLSATFVSIRSSSSAPAPATGGTLARHQTTHVITNCRALLRRTAAGQIRHSPDAVHQALRRALMVRGRASRPHVKIRKS